MKLALLDFILFLLSNFGNTTFKSGSIEENEETAKNAMKQRFFTIFSTK